MTAPRFTPINNSSNHDRMKGLLFLALLLLAPILETHAYADWLKCHVELDDEDEVIMHKPIVQFQDQSEEEKMVKLEIQPYVSPKGSPWLASSPQDLENAEASTLWKVRLQVPPSLRRKSVQFVVDATGEGASFVGSSVMCDGKRAFSKKYDNYVLLQIQPSESPSDIGLFAGWAAGYQAVKVTSKIILKRTSSDEMISSSDEL